MTTRQPGRDAERFACHYLQKQGLILLEQNFNCRVGEIDLIMKDSKRLVFVEVRLRNHPHYGGALCSVDKRKQLKIQKTAAVYLKMKNFKPQPSCRFDVVGVEFEPQVEVTWRKEAFEAC